MSSARRAKKLRRLADQYERAAAPATRIGYDAGVIAFFPAGGTVMILDNAASRDLFDVVEEVRQTAPSEDDLASELDFGETIWRSYHSLAPETAASLRRALRLAAERKRTEADALTR